jgi:hypothetical protein
MPDTINEIDITKEEKEFNESVDKVSTLAKNLAILFSQSRADFYQAIQAFGMVLGAHMAEKLIQEVYELLGISKSSLPPDEE